jgi:hypothetical protein
MVEKSGYHPMPEAGGTSTFGSVTITNNARSLIRNNDLWRMSVTVRDNGAVSAS